MWQGKNNNCTYVLAKTILCLVYGNNIIIIIILKHLKQQTTDSPQTCHFVISLQPKLFHNYINTI